MPFFSFNDFSIGGGDNQLPSSITDLFNGFNRTSGDSFTGGPTVVPDNLGALTTSPVNVLAVQGARYSAGWLPTNAAGDQLFPSQSIRTRKGTAAKYDSTFKGYLNEPAATNSLLHASDLTNAAWVKTLGTAAKTATGPDGVANSGSTFTATAINGTVLQTLTLASAARSSSVYLRRKTGTGTVNFTRDGVTWTDITSLLNSSTYTRVKIDNTSVLNPVIGVQLAVSGDAVDFYNAQDTAGAFTTSPIATTIATVTRPATNYTRPTAGVLRSNDWGVWGRVVPSAAGQDSKELFSIAVDGSNYVNIISIANGTSLAFFKRVGGVSYTASSVVTFVAGSVLNYQLAVTKTGAYIRTKLDNAAWTGWSSHANSLDIPLPTTFQIGARSNSAHFAGNFPMTMIVQSGDPKATLEALALRYP